MKTIPWDFLRENPVEKTIDLDLDALVAPLKEIGRGMIDGKPAIVEYTGAIDLFEDKVSDDAIAQAIAVMIACPFARFLVATVRPQGAKAFLDYLRPKLPAIGAYVSEFGAIVGLPGCFTIKPTLAVIPNLALGVAVSDQASADDRVGILLSVPAAFHYAAHAPMTGPIDWTSLRPDLGSHDALGYRLDALAGEIRFADGRKALDANGALDWIFASGEGRGYRNAVHPDWPRQDMRQAEAAGVPFAFASWGTLVPGVQVAVEAPPAAPARAEGPKLGDAWSRRLAGEDVAGPVEIDVDEEAIEALRAHHAARRGKMVQGIDPDGRPATIAIPSIDEDPAWTMIPAPAGDALPILDGAPRFDVPEFLDRLS